MSFMNLVLDGDHDAVIDILGLGLQFVTQA